MSTDLKNSMALSLKGPEHKRMHAISTAKEVHNYGATPELKRSLELVFAFGVGGAIWYMPAPLSVGAGGVHFLATLAVAVILWIFEVFDEYVVALVLLLSWLILDIVPSQVALSGFSKGSWVFAVGALGMAAAVFQSGLLYRLSLLFLRRIPSDHYKTILCVVSGLGVLATPLIPTSKARVSLIAPVSQALSDSMGFQHRSNGSAGLVFSAYIGFSQFSFLFLTGASQCLIGWSFLPESTKAEFGWMMWTLAALPAGILTFVFFFAAINLLFPLNEGDRAKASWSTVEHQLATLGKMTRAEWLSIAVSLLAVAGWLTSSAHGIDEAWIALGALLFCLLTGLLDKSSFRKSIDWGFLLFLGVTYSLGDIFLRLKIDHWLLELLDPILGSFSFHPTAFLTLVVLLVYVLRIFLRKSSTVMLLMLTLMPWTGELEIHPGVLLITILFAGEAWFLPHQDNSYQLVYSSVDGKAFSHAQARKLMIAKFLSCFAAVAVSVPYWQLLGFIK
jgi:anion transporter